MRKKRWVKGTARCILPNRGDGQFGVREKKRGKKKGGFWSKKGLKLHDRSLDGEGQEAMRGQGGIFKSYHRGGRRGGGRMRTAMGQAVKGGKSNESSFAREVQVKTLLRTQTIEAGE